jgi:nitric oxide reductase NorQ protein
MGNVATTPVLSGRAGDSGVTPSKMASLVSRGSATEKWGHVAKTPSTSEMWTVELFGDDGVAIHAKGAFNVSDVDDRWSAATIAVHGDAKGISVERLNKIMRLLTDSVGSAPRIDLYWRTGKAAVRCPGYAGRTNVPVLVRGTTPIGGGDWSWDMATFGGKVIPPGKPRKPQTKSVKAPASAPIVATPTPSVTPPTPSPKVTSRAERKEARRAAAAEQRQVASAQVEPKAREVKASGTTSPVIFADPATIKPGFAVHHDATMLADLKREAKLHASGRRTVVLISGPTGTGKTLTAKHVAADEGLPFLKVDAVAMATFFDWVGGVGLTSGEGVHTEFQPSLLLEAIRADGPFGGIRRMVLIDEVNRVTQGSSLGAIIPMTDGQGTVYVPDARQSIPVDPAVMWVMTANIGAAYSSGTVQVDPAIMNRITSHLEVRYPAAVAERQMLVEQGGCTQSIADALIKAAAQVRAVYDSGAIATPPVSTRQLIEAAAKVAAGCDPIHACELAFAHNYSAEGGADSERSKVMVAVNAVLRGVK